MHNRSKKPVWALLKIFEIVISSVCCYTHMDCYINHGMPNSFILCATYASGLIIGCLSLIGSFFYERVAVRAEALISAILGTLNMVTVYVHMYLLQHNELLPFLRESERQTYDFVVCCKNNATWAWFAVAIYYLHCTFALDVICYREKNTDTVVRSKRRIKLYFVSKQFEQYVSRFRWFKLLSVNITQGTAAASGKRVLHALLKI
ncbi:uncharacterized protein LOC111603833 [Drosophila hydei]|uniref:Uncharacterized protein LOC111603833 n=1 Tax=Drosophila hydei TaxID=7224 RepID=A0A6J1M802_DROHY|nr:uncharacterized protein LOC111603833 [Drosophila hydei]